MSHKRTHALGISGLSNVPVSESFLDWIIKTAIITTVWMAQIYKIEARPMEQEGPDIYEKKNNL